MASGFCFSRGPQARAVSPFEQMRPALQHRNRFDSKHRLMVAAIWIGED